MLARVLGVKCAYGGLQAVHACLENVLIDADFLGEGFSELVNYKFTRLCLM